MKAIRLIKNRLLEADDPVSTEPEVGTEAAAEASGALAVTLANTEDVIKLFNNKIEAFNGYTKESLDKTLEVLNTISDLTLAAADSSSETTASTSTEVPTEEAPIEVTVDDLKNLKTKIIDSTNTLEQRLNINDHAKQIKAGDNNPVHANKVKSILRITLDLLKQATTILKDTKYNGLYTVIDKFIKDNAATTVNINDTTKTSVDATDYILTILKAIPNEIDKAITDMSYDSYGSDGKTSGGGSSSSTTATTVTSLKDRAIEAVEDFNGTSIPANIASISKQLEEFNNKILSEKATFDLLIKNDTVQKKILSVFGEKNILDNLPPNDIMNKASDAITSANLNALISILNSLAAEYKLIANLADTKNGNMAKLFNQIFELINSIKGAKNDKPSRDWKQLLKEAATKGSVTVPVKEGDTDINKKLNIAGVWDLYYKEDWDDKFGAGIGAKVKALGGSFIDEVMVLGFDASTNPFIKFIQLALKNHDLIIPSLSYSAIHNAYIDRTLSTKDLHGNGILGENNLIFKQALYNVPAKDAERYLKLQKTCADIAGTSDAKNTLKAGMLADTYGGKPLDLINAVFFVGGDPLTLTAPTDFSKLKPIGEAEALLKRCSDKELFDEDNKTEFSTENKEIQELVTGRGGTASDAQKKINAINLIKYLLATYNYLDKAPEIFAKYGIRDTNLDLTSASSGQFNRVLKNVDIKKGSINQIINDIAKLGGLTS